MACSWAVCGQQAVSGVGKALNCSDLRYIFWVLCRTLSPAEECGQALFGQKAFSSAAAVSQSWQGLVGSSAAVTALVAALPPMAELGCEEMKGTALLESLCTHMEASAPGLAGTHMHVPFLFAK